MSKADIDINDDIDVDDAIFNRHTLLTFSTNNRDKTSC